MDKEDTFKVQKTHPPRKNSAIRKEKSKVAARVRRSHEAEIFNELSELLPITPREIAQLDKTSIIRIAINFLKIRHLLGPVQSKFPIAQNGSSSCEQDDCPENAMEALDGFMLILSQQGDMVYLSHNVDRYLGLTQIDMMGNSIYDYTHQCDHKHIKDILELKFLNEGPTLPLKHDSLPMERDNSRIPCSFFMRMKSTLANRRSSKASSYKVIHCSGSFFSLANTGIESNKMIPNGSPLSCTSTNEPYCLITIGESMEMSLQIERPLSKSGFVSHHTLDMKFTLVDDTVLSFLGYNDKELVGKSLYNYFHIMDLTHLDKFCKTLFEKGQCETGSYRFLAKRGGFAWVLTRATLVQDDSAQPQSIVCINYVLSGIENQESIISQEQAEVECVAHDELICMTDEIAICDNTELVENQSSVRSPLEEHPLSSTITIFAPREDMESGYLMFSDHDNELTIIPDNEVIGPIDLTHLAPHAGDVCVSLDVPDVLSMDDLLNEMFLDQSAIDNGNSLGDNEKIKHTRQEDNMFANEMALSDHSDPANEMFKKIGKDDCFFLDESIQNGISHGCSKDMSASELHSPLNNDPFLSYQDDPLSSSPSSCTSSDPYCSSKSNSPTNVHTNSPILTSATATSTTFNKSNWDASKLNELEQEEFDLRAPYIPDDDYQLLLNEEISSLTFASTNIDEAIHCDSSTYKSVQVISNASMRDNLNHQYRMPTNSNNNLNYSSNLAMLLQSDQHAGGRGRTTTVTQVGKNKRATRNVKNANISLQQLNNYNVGSKAHNQQLEKNVGNLNQFSNVQSYQPMIGDNRNKCHSMNSAMMGQYWRNASDNSQVRHALADEIKSRMNKSGQMNEMTWNARQSDLQANNMLKRPYPSSEPAHTHCNINANYYNANVNVNDHSKRVKGSVNVTQQQVKTPATSVLMNLLVNGEDASNGYSKYSSHNHFTSPMMNRNHAIRQNNSDSSGHANPASPSPLLSGLT